MYGRDENRTTQIPALHFLSLDSMALTFLAPSSSLNGLNGRSHWGYGGSVPEHVSSEQCYKSRKKSNVRLNDQLVPKPTDVNVVEKRIPNVKEHPFSSHISRFAMFPSFCSPDDMERGVRAALRPFPNRHVSNRTPNVTLLSKTIGGPYRHEVSGTPLNTRRKAVMWTGEFDGNPSQEEKRGFYPAPTKTILPNPKLRDWDVTLSERTSNMLKNLERTLWVTSYQMHYTGSGPANPLKTDDFNERIRDLSGKNSHSAPLREQSYPVFVPSRPKEERKQWSNVQFDEAPSQQSESQTLKVGPSDQTSSRSHRPLVFIEQEGQMEDGELLHSAPNSSILPRPPILPGIHPAAPGLLELQQSFSKSDAHKNFHGSVRQAAVNLRDNVVSGKKHNFFGINCNYIHG
ncbi:uncharacterized protein C7orf31 [Austrofundulus limnaeus]|uniref:Uncharacterized protein C7orf31 n=1 Tax=Austrofundulus limnaeus TaxID=52670 RepID=A0A2I4B928_AUSLI|nr:PREDICTED: uncharacterized protein C7orf31 homolog [Austrofundulus limnaeus]